MIRNQPGSLISPAEFVHGIRHSSYQSLASAIAELVDNAIEAEATRIDVDLTDDLQQGPIIKVLDNGLGMTPTVLHRCLQFGGTSRFNSRRGLGRFGLGLPMSSLSYARRVSVCSWRSRYQVHRCHLDVDEVSEGSIDIERPEMIRNSGIKSNSGTLITWEKCDRIDLKRPRETVSGLCNELGRRFRRFLLGDVKIFVNGDSVDAVDPLFRLPDNSGVRATMYGPDINLRVRLQSNHSENSTGDVNVRFTELPVKEWFTLSSAEKRKKGISRGAGVSILRAGREVDFGWYFMGEKRRENYDDWWRCEIEFSPILDEEFGISHTKQQIRPAAEIIEAISIVVEPIARTLSSRARKSHEAIASHDVKRDPLIEVANNVERYLPDTPAFDVCRIKGFDYSVTSTPRTSPELYSPVLADGTLTLLFNSAHEYFRRIDQIANIDGRSAGSLMSYIEVLLLAASRAEIAAPLQDAEAIKKFRTTWGKIVSVYLSG